MRRRHLTVIGTALLATGVLLAPLGASAGTPVFVSFISDPGATRVLKVSDPTSTNPATVLTGTDVHVVRYSVSQDGNTWVASVAVGPVSDTSGEDSTWAVVWVHRNGATVTARILANYFNSNPVIGQDGKTYWLVTEPGTDISDLYVYDGINSSAAPSAVPSTSFTPDSPLYTPVSLAISPSGTNVAVMYRGSTTATQQTGEVITQTIGGGTKGNFYKAGYPTAGLTFPTPADFVWSDDSTLWYATTTDPTELTWQSNLVGMSANGSSGTSTPGPANYYDVAPLGVGNWWLWKDTAVPAKSTGYTAASPNGATTNMGDRTDGPTTVLYLPSTQVPAPLTSVVNQQAASPALLLSAALVGSGKRVAYLSTNLYLTALPGQTFAADALGNFRGTLQSSINGGVTWVNVATTTGAHFTSTSLYNGTSPAMSRNTWYRWFFPGDIFSAPGFSAVRLVRVVPTLTAVSTLSAGRFVVHGRILRSGGVAYLYRYVGKARVLIAHAAVTATGLYSFGARALPRGLYYVYVPASPYWATSAVNVRV